MRAQEEVAQQILELRERRHFRQMDLARAAKMKQSAVSRLEKADYSAWTYKTLLRVAEALDAQLRVIFEAYEDVIARYETEPTEQAEIPLVPRSANATPSLVELWLKVNGRPLSDVAVKEEANKFWQSPFNANDPIVGSNPFATPYGKVEDPYAAVRVAKFVSLEERKSGREYQQ